MILFIKLFIAVILFVAVTILPGELVLIISPVLIYLASGIANWVKAKLTGQEGGFGGLIFTAVLVPALSLILTFFVPVEGTSFILQFLIGCAAVTVNELIKQFKQSISGKQTNAKKSLFG